MSSRLHQRVRIWAAATLASALGGAGYAGVISLTEARASVESIFLRGFVYGVIIGGSVGAFLLFYVMAQRGAWLRRLSFPVSLSLRVATATVIMSLGLAAGRLLFPSPDGFNPYYFGMDLLFSFVMLSAIFFVVAVRQIVGGRVLGNFVLGRYHKPVREDRVFLFLDLANSTALSQRLGDTGVHALISRVFFDIDPLILDWRGEVHRYVGDEVVVTWPLADCHSDGRCLECVFAINDLIAAKAEQYLRAFGVVPVLRAGLHGGAVVAGECGDSKQEIVYFGDTINTAARIQAECKTWDESVLISGELLAELPLPEGVRADSLGLVLLRGREEATELFSLELMAEAT